MWHECFNKLNGPQLPLLPLGTLEIDNVCFLSNHIGSLSHYNELVSNTDFDMIIESVISPNIKCRLYYLNHHSLYFLLKICVSAGASRVRYAHESVLKRCGIINTLTIGSREWGGVVLLIFTEAWQWWIVNKDYLQSIKIQVFHYQVYAEW